MISAGETIPEAREFAQRLSAKNPGKYITIYYERILEHTKLLLVKL